MSKKIATIVNSWKPSIKNLCFGDAITDFDSMTAVLRNPKLKLKDLWIWEDDVRSFELVGLELKNAKHKVKVNSLVIRSMNVDAGPMIYKLDPEILRMVEIPINNPSIDDMNRLLDSDQLRTMHCLTISTHLPTVKFPIECFYNRRSCSIQFRGRRTKETRLIIIIKNLLKKCVNLYRWDFDFDPPLFYLELVKNSYTRPETIVPFYPDFRRLEIPGTNYINEITFLERGITIMRKLKPSDRQLKTERQARRTYAEFGIFF